MDLICYTYPGWDPRLRPASSRREWMDETAESFAYRCLPLAIANAHGWEALSPCGFEARWNGGPLVEDVEVRLDPGVEARRAPLSLFGQGTVTFHIEGLFRTPPGWNLWVGGSPNHAKDGIAPLGGVIETDWSPYTFTMNWRFTRPDQWVRFEENEPICFLFPVERKALVEMDPRIVPIDEAPDLKAQFEKWSQSRNAFQQWVRETNPTVPAEKWQKLYYRGVDPDGRPGADDHASKLRLKPFVNPDGSAMAPPEAKKCPMRNGPVAEKVAEAMAGAGSGAGNPALALTLSRIGFEAKPDAPPRIDPASAAVATDLKRREWYLEIAERQRSLSPRTGGIQRVRGITSEEFLDQFYAPGRPVIIEGELEDWPALQRWTPEYLRERVGSAEIEYQGGREASADFELYKDNHKQVMPFDRYIDLITARGYTNDAYITAYNSNTNKAALQPLQAELGGLEKFLARPEGMMWIGPMGTFTPLHHDLTNNLLAQVCGSKHLVLLPPSEAPRLYNRTHVFSEVGDIMDPEQLANYPLAAEAQSFEVDLEAGQLLFIPVAWWHQVTALDFSVTLTYIDFRWPNQSWKSFPAD